MHLPPLQPVVNSDIYIYGDVEIHPTASVAPGVILQAVPQSRIVIGADACIGMGVVINAYNGVIEVESGATLGAGVLIIGKAVIGRNSCIGTATTIFNTSVEPMKVVTPGSILGDTTRSVKPESGTDSSNGSKSKTNFSHLKTTTSSNGDVPTVATSEQSSTAKNIQPQSSSEVKPSVKEVVNDSIYDQVNDPWSEENEADRVTETVATIQVEEVVEEAKNSEGIAIGKVYIDQLLVTLFPHKKIPDNSSSSNIT